MIEISPQELVIRTAMATVGAQEVPPASNAGAFVERILKLCGLGPGSPWCAAVVAGWGTSALKEKWPVPKTASCYQLGEWAKKHHILSEAPERGSVFLIWHPELNRFAHTGLVLDYPNTISGNTTKPGQSGNSREGWVVAEKPWPFKPADRYIHWWPML